MIALVRHPAVHAAGRCYGRTDLPLADPVAARALAGRLKGLGGMVWTSPLRRCRDVAEALGPHCIDDRLMELDFGAWENRPWDEVPRSALDEWAADPWGFAPPNGETGASLVARIRAFHDTLPGGDHVVISHGGPLKVLASLMVERPVDLLAPPPATGSVTILAAPTLLPLPLGEGLVNLDRQPFVTAALSPPSPSAA